MALSSKPGRAKKENKDMAAMVVVYEALLPLDVDTQRWILRSLIERFNLGTLDSEAGRSSTQSDASGSVPEADIAQPLPTKPAQDKITEPAPVDSGAPTSGISPIAQKWMRRSDLTSAQLGTIYSLNFDEIDLVSPSVPGKSVKNRMRNVLMLKCMASYLGTGAARVPHDKAREACVHYRAWDKDNLASYLKSFAREVSGNKESGYTLTPAGMAAATDLIKEMIANPPVAAGRRAKS